MRFCDTGPPLWSCQAIATQQADIAFDRRIDDFIIEVARVEQQLPDIIFRYTRTLIEHRFDHLGLARWIDGEGGNDSVWICQHRWLVRCRKAVSTLEALHHGFGFAGAHTQGFNVLAIAAASSLTLLENFLALHAAFLLLLRAP